MKMTIQEISDRLVAEKSTPNRWPVRLIFTESLDGYSSVVTALHSLCDLTFSLAEFTKLDSLPNFDQLKDKINANKDKFILLTDLSEYIRICIGYETSEDRRFKGLWEMQMEAHSKTRIIIPLFRCADIFARLVPEIGERQENYLYTLEEKVEKVEYTVSVYSTDFKDGFQADAFGMKSWLSNWFDLMLYNKRCSLITKLLKYSEPLHGDVIVNTITDPFSFAIENVKDGNNLKKEWFDDWGVIAGKILKDELFKEFILRELNVTSFNFTEIAPRLNSLKPIQRNCVWIWYQLYPDDSYCSYAIRSARIADEISLVLRDKILDLLNVNSEWVNERNNIVRSLGFHKFDLSYFSKLDKLPFEKKVGLLTFSTRDEYVFALKIAGQLLRNGMSTKDVEKLFEKTYPVLACYLNTKSTDDYDVDTYLCWYKTQKLKNRMPEVEPPLISLDNFDSRHKKLTKYERQDCFALWIDGLGMEWLSLLLQHIQEKVQDVTIAPDLAKAIAPSETGFNKYWGKYKIEYKKLDRLDDLSHNGVPDDTDFYSCIVSQFEIICEIAEEAAALIKEYNTVIITGDHGSSRLAALAFHANDGVIPNSNWKVKNHGRYCELPDELPFNEIPEEFEQIKTDESYFLVSKSYAHFKQPGNAPFEIHGGGAPEEMIVPVVVIKRNTPLPVVSDTIIQTKPRGIGVNEMGMP